MNNQEKITNLLNELTEQNFVTSSFSYDLNCLEEFTNILLKWNNSHDLVSQKSFSEIFDHHIIDSIAAFIIQLNVIDFSPTDYIDIGSGAGLPGIVWHICFGQKLKTILVEPRKKRINFLKEVRRSLKLENLDFIDERFKELPNKIDPCVVSIRALKPDQIMLDSICLEGNSNNQLLWLGSETSGLEVSEKIKVEKIEYGYNLGEKYKRSILVYKRA